MAREVDDDCVAVVHLHEDESPGTNGCPKRGKYREIAAQALGKFLQGQ
jgi:hypothetical protein